MTIKARLRINSELLKANLTRRVAKILVLDGYSYPELGLGSIAANLTVDEKHYCVGLEVNGNHLKAVRKGNIYATAKSIHLGRSTQVWDIKIKDEAGNNVCISRLTMAVLVR